jgi:hypothetical protein
VNNEIMQKINSCGWFEIYKIINKTLVRLYCYR